MVNGGIYNFDLTVYNNGNGTYTLAEGFSNVQNTNHQNLLQATILGPYITNSYISVETTSALANLGDLMNFDMYSNTWIQREYYSLDEQYYTEWPYPASIAKMGYLGETDGTYNDLYCDRPRGSEPFSYITYYQSGFLDSMNVRQSCT